MKRLVSVLGVLAALLGFIAAPAAVAKTVDPTCARIDSYSASGAAHVAGTACITDQGWKHGELDATCTVRTVGWQNAPKCAVAGRYVVLKDGKLLPAYEKRCPVPDMPQLCVTGKSFGGSSATAKISLGSALSFSCDGPGTYTLRISHLSFSMDARDDRRVSIAGPIEASKKMC